MNDNTTITVGEPSPGDIIEIVDWSTGNEGDFSTKEFLTTEQTMAVMREIRIEDLTLQGVETYRRSFPESTASDDAVRAHVRALVIAYLDGKGVPTP